MRIEVDGLAAQMNEDRVVDIWFSEKKTFGSGYLLTDRLALTACHVFDLQPPDTPCIVRRWTDPKNMPGKILWSSRPHDAGLVLLDVPIMHSLGPNPAFGRSPTRHASTHSYPCKALGYPRASIDEQRRRDDRMIEGRATLTGRSKRFNFDSEVRPSKKDGWRGLSGAALFRRAAGQRSVEELLFAIVGKVPMNWDGNTLTAQPIAALFEDDGFLQALAQGGLSRPRLVKLRHPTHFGTLWKEVKKRCHQMDRDVQIDKFRESLRLRPSRAFLFTGKRADWPDMLLRRLVELDEFQDAVGSMGVHRAIQKIEWPDAQALKDPDSAFRDLYAQAADKLDLRLKAEDGDDAFATELLKRSPAAIWWEVTPDLMGKGHGRLLARWIKFCTRVQARAPLYWFVFWANDEKKPGLHFWRRGSGDRDIARILRKLRAPGRVESLDTLEPISMRHLGEWLTRLRWEGLVDKDDQDDMIELVDARLLKDLRLPLRQFVRCMEEALEGADA